jgi:hypothetical protein
MSDISTVSQSSYSVAVFGSYELGDPNKRCYCILGRIFLPSTSIDDVSCPCSFFLLRFLFEFTVLHKE